MLFSHGGDQLWRRRFLSGGRDALSVDPRQSALVGCRFRGPCVVGESGGVRLRPFERSRSHQHHPASASRELVQQFSVGLSKCPESRRAVHRLDLAELRDDHGRSHPPQLLRPSAEGLTAPAFTDRALEVDGIPIPGHIAKPRSLRQKSGCESRFEPPFLLQPHHVRAPDKRDDVVFPKRERLRSGRREAKKNQENEVRCFHSAFQGNILEGDDLEH